VPSPRQLMDDALKAEVIPGLRDAGFKGAFPHLRRLRPTGVDLLTFQFDRRGGGFVIEIARCGPEGVTLHWGEHVPSSKVRALDVHPDRRVRIKPRNGAGTDSWFRFDSGKYIEVAASVRRELDRAYKYWDTGA
jgi:Domain of unknown function (DUF4304)